MSLSSCLIEFSITILTFSPIIKLLNWLYNWFVWTCPKTSLFIIIISRIRSFHCCSKHFTLSFPFGYFTSSFNRLFLIRLSFLLFYRGLSRRFFPIVIILIIFINHFSLFFSIKFLSFLNKYFEANLFMFLDCFLIEFSTTCWAFNSILSIIILFFVLRILTTCLFINTHTLLFSITCFILIKVLGFFFFILYIIFLLFFYSLVSYILKRLNIVIIFILLILWLIFIFINGIQFSTLLRLSFFRFIASTISSIK